MLHELLANPAFPRALAVGAFGGVGLVLTVVYSRRGPMIFVPYAALLAALTLLLSRFGQLPYAPRFAAAFAAFAIATVPVPPRRFSLWDHVWRIGFVIAAGGIVSAGVAFVAA